MYPTKLCYFLVFGILIVHSVYSVKYTTCEDTWTALDGNCYLIGHYRLKFVEAEHFCRQHKSHVIEPYDTYANNFIKDQFRYLKLECGWIGATDELVEDNWQWYTSGNHVNFTDWFPGQPARESGDEDCLVYYHGYDYKWGDIKCEYVCNPVCKKVGFVLDGSEIVG